MISANLLAIFYLISGVLFILALRGLSSPETSRQGNLFGIIGMAIAIGVTIISVGNFSTVFLYLMTFGRELLDEEGVISKELKIHDLSKLDNKTPITSDEALYEISEIKKDMNQLYYLILLQEMVTSLIEQLSGAHF